MECWDKCYECFYGEEDPDGGDDGTDPDGDGDDIPVPDPDGDNDGPTVQDGEFWKDLLNTCGCMKCGKDEGDTCFDECAVCINEALDEKEEVVNPDDTNDTTGGDDIMTVCDGKCDCEWDDDKCWKICDGCWEEYFDKLDGK